MGNPVVSISKDVMGGTRVPIETLVDCLKTGDSIDDFLDGFPAVEPEQVIRFLEEAEKQMEL